MAAIGGGGLFLGLVGFFAWRWVQHALHEIQISRARESFLLQRERLQQMFFDAASSTGKPKGLRWKACDFGSEFEMARDRRTGEVVGLVPVTISFEAIAGSDMEGVAAVGNLRDATAIFSFSRGTWGTVGRAVFNLSPLEVIRHFQGGYDRMKPGAE